MGMLSKNHRRNGNGKPDPSPELRQILSAMQQERQTFEALTVRAEQSAAQIERLTQPAQESKATFAEFEDRMQSVQKLVTQIGSVRQRTEAVSNAQEQTEQRLAEALGRAEQFRAMVETFGHTVNDAQSLKTQLAELLEHGDGFKMLRQDSIDLEQRLKEFADNFGSMRKQHDDMLCAHQDAISRVAAADELQITIHDRIDQVATRLESLEHNLDSVSELTETIPNAKRELSTLKALGDYVAQKVSALEQQRAAVDRAVHQATHLNVIATQIDDEVHKQRDYASTLGDIQARVDEVAALHTNVLQQSEDIAARQEQVERQGQAMRDELDAGFTKVRDEVEKATSRFEFGTRSLESVTHRTTDLQATLTTIETRFQELEEPKQTIAELHSTAKHLSSQVEGITEVISDLETQAERVRTVRSSIDLVENTTCRLEKRVAALEEPAVLTKIDGAERRIADAENAVESLEQRSQYMETLADRITTFALQLEQRQGAIEAAAERLDASETHRREVAATTQALEEQSTQLTDTLAAAGAQTDQISDLLHQLDDRTGSIQRFERRMTQFEERVAKWELAELQLSQGVKQVAERQATFDALRADLKSMFTMAQKTAEDMRSIAEAREEIARDRAVVTEVMDEVRQVKESADVLADRKKQIEAAENRLSRADALLIDIRSTLENIQGQKTFLDRVMNKTGSLTFQIKQAEALIANLRNERKVAGGIRDASEPTLS
jgi:chromosome segregation ATPase